ncbi:MAG: 1-acyl-sn-glycerol-3-phosphate acyltransferase, partial [Desulfobacterales bacterium]
MTKTLAEARNHYACCLPEDIGVSAAFLLKRFYSGIRVDRDQIAALQKLEKESIVIFATKFQSSFDFLFAYIRYREEHLPFPQIGFDYNLLIWQPVARVLKILVGYLDHLIRHRSWPDPYESGYIQGELLRGRSGFLALVGKKGFSRRFLKAKIDPIECLIEMQKTQGRPICIVPQLMFFSRKPHRADPSLLNMLFGPDDKPGWPRRLITLFRNPGKVFVELSEPVNLKNRLADAAFQNQSPEDQAGELRRRLLHQLNRHRQSITGPVLKSREELQENILTSDRFQAFMNQYAANRNITIHEVRRKADAYLEEIAASYSPGLISVAAGIVGWIIRTMYDGVTVNTDRLNQVKSMALKGPLLLIPCHKSHIDYLLLSHLLYQHHMPCPHIAAGKNLSFWPMGPLFRRGGAFFIRRSFRGAVLYSRVFAEYMHKLLEEGHNIEQFIEGGRSRTGKLLMPKLGLLSILLNAYKNGACEDMIIVPIFIGYDRVIEESSYLHELEGGQKQPENFWQVIRARKFLKKRYGKIYVQFHEPLSLAELLKRSDTPLAHMT